MFWAVILTLFSNSIFEKHDELADFYQPHTRVSHKHLPNDHEMFHFVVAESSKSIIVASLNMFRFSKLISMFNTL